MRLTWLRYPGGLTWYHVIIKRKGKDDVTIICDHVCMCDIVTNHSMTESSTQMPFRLCMLLVHELFPKYLFLYLALFQNEYLDLANLNVIVVKYTTDVLD